MARVILPDDYCNNRIPTVDDFRFLRREIHERLNTSSSGVYDMVIFGSREIHERLNTSSSGVYGVVIFGSVGRGDFNPTSDLDLVVMVESWGDLDRTMKLFSGISLYAEARYLPFRPIFVSREQAKFGMHSFSRSFIEHLRGSEIEGLVFGKCITSELKESIILPTVEAMPYALHKIGVVVRGLASLNSSNAEDYCQVLENVLQVPIYYARKYLYDCCMLGQSDGKLEVAKRFLNDGPGALKEPFVELLGLQEKYLKVIQDPRRDRHKYWLILREVEKGLNTLVSFLDMALKLKHR